MHPVKVLKSHLQLIHGSMISDHIRTRFLGGDLYARATYMRVYTVSVILQFNNSELRDLYVYGSVNS